MKIILHRESSARSSRVLLRAALMFGALVIISAGVSEAKTRRGVSEKTLRDTTFENGLTVLAMEDSSDPLIALWVQYRAGSRDDPPGKSGMAKVAREIFIGGSLGYRKGEYSRLIHSSGGSSFSGAWDDAAFYAARFPRERLREVALIEADRMEYPQISSESLAAAKAATLAERRLHLQTNTYAPLVMELFHSMYLEHPYGKTSWGLESEISSLTVEEVEDWMYDRYRPANAVICAVGDFKTSELFATMAEIFGDIPSGARTTTTYPAEPEQLAERRSQVRSSVHIPVFIVGYHIPESTHPDIFALRALSKILIGERSSRVYQRLVTESGRCLFAGGSLADFSDPGLIYFYAFMNHGEKLEDAEETLFAELASAASTGVAEAELIIAKNQLESELYLAAAPAMERAGLIANSFALWDDGMHWMQAIEQIQNVTTEDVRRVAAKYLKPENRTVIQMIPRTSGVGAVDETGSPE